MLSPNNETVPLHLRRPSWVDARIDDRFIEVTNVLYTSSGVRDDYSVFHDPETAQPVLASSVVAKIASRLDRPVRILDIGTGYGGFILRCQRDGHEAHGVSAYDYAEYGTKQSEDTQQLKPGTYIVADANQLGSVNGLFDEYDLVFSRNTFQHLVDPLGALEQASDRVGKDGVIAVSDLHIGAYADVIRVPIDAIEAGGFIFEGPIDTQLLQGTVYATRAFSDSRVSFPASYVQVPGFRVGYSWHPSE